MFVVDLIETAITNEIPYPMCFHHEDSVFVQKHFDPFADVVQLVDMREHIRRENEFRLPIFFVEGFCKCGCKKGFFGRNSSFPTIFRNPGRWFDSNDGTIILEGCEKRSV